MNQQACLTTLPYTSTKTRGLPLPDKEQGNDSDDTIIIVIKGGKVVRFDNNVNHPSLELTDGDGI